MHVSPNMVTLKGCIHSCNKILLNFLEYWILRPKQLPDFPTLRYQLYILLFLSKEHLREGKEDLAGRKEKVALWGCQSVNYQKSQHPFCQRKIRF